MPRDDVGKSVYRIRLEAGGAQANLRIEISDLPGKEKWMCNPSSFLGEADGVVAWKGTRIGLFSHDTMQMDNDIGYKVVKPGAQALAILDIPREGLDSVAEGEGGTAYVSGREGGSWTRRGNQLF